MGHKAAAAVAAADTEVSPVVEAALAEATSPPPLSLPRPRVACRLAPLLKTAPSSGSPPLTASSHRPVVRRRSARRARLPRAAEEPSITSAASGCTSGRRSG